MGYVTANVKSSTGTLVGDTMYHKSEPVEPLPGFRPAKAMVGQCQLCIWLLIGQLTLTGTCRLTDKHPSFISKDYLYCFMMEVPSEHTFCLYGDHFSKNL